MGCNSHLSIEYRPGHAGDITRWDTYALDVPESRNYVLYEAMAGVRGEESNAVCPARGEPKDVSRAVKVWLDRWEADGHSTSYLYPSEFRQCTDRQSGSGYTLAKEWQCLLVVLEGLGKIYGESNVRVVFFFDN